jgi:hypothetical protein
MLSGRKKKDYAAESAADAIEAHGRRLRHGRRSDCGDTSIPADEPPRTPRSSRLTTASSPLPSARTVSAPPSSPPVRAGPIRAPGPRD